MEDVGLSHCEDVATMPIYTDVVAILSIQSINLNRSQLHLARQIIFHPLTYKHGSLDILQSSSRLHSCH